MSLPAYAEYKDSGVEWLGDVPKHWFVLKISRIFEIKAGGDLKPEFFSETKDELHPYPIYTNSVDENFVYGYTSKNIFPANTVTVTGRGGIGYAIFRDQPYDAIIRLLVLKPLKQIQPKLYAYLINAVLEFSEGNSAIAQLSADQIAPYKVSCPPLTEQKAIVDFLDYETAKIDALIAEQQRLIELLKEKRQAVISHAVTKGLDPNAPMKDSGVEWLGDVPEHWEVLPLKYLVAIRITDGPHETPDFIDEGVPFVSAEAVGKGILDFNKIRGFISQESHDIYSRKYKPKRNDIFMVKSGATTGVSAIVDTDQDFNIWSPLAVIRCNSLVEPAFVLNAIRSKEFFDGIVLNWSFGTQQNIGMNVIENLRIPVPTKIEQGMIVSYLASSLQKFDAMTETAYQGIDLLKERRSALISAAVTGKIDVRGWQPPATAATTPQGQQQILFDD